MAYRHPGAEQPVLANVAFTLLAGKVLGLIGPSGAGKTTLARLAIGNLQPTTGHVRLDGVELSQRAGDDRGRHIGYLPQDTQLFAGSVRDNIARMGESSPEAVIDAARLASVHELILQLPQGYETEVGDGGSALSGGQRQRIALARALFGQPSLVVLDEPNSNLDQPGIEALLNAIANLRVAGTTVIVIAHQPSILQQADFLLVLGDGRMQILGPRDEVIARVTGPEPGARAQLAPGEANG